MSNPEGPEALVNDFEKTWQEKYDAAEAKAFQDRKRRRQNARQPHDIVDSPLEQAQNINRVAVSDATEPRAASAAVSSAGGMHNTRLSLLLLDWLFCFQGVLQLVSVLFATIDQLSTKKAYTLFGSDGHKCWACNCQSKNNPDERCGIIPSSTNNTTNMWSHIRNHHAETFTSLQRRGVLPNEITVITASPTKPAMAIRPKFSLQTKGQADGLATEWLLDSHGSLTACENQRHRDYVSFLSGGAYKSPSYYTVKKHTTMFATDGRKTSSEFVSELAKDNVTPTGASDPWSNNGIGLLGSNLHGISRQPPSILISDHTLGSMWELETHLAGASPFEKLHHTATIIK